MKLKTQTKIPEDWEEVELKEITKLIRNGLTNQQNKEGKGLPITRIETVSDEIIDPAKVGYIENLRNDQIEEYKLRKGDILFSHINSVIHIGKTAIYENNPKLLIHGMNLLLLRPKENVDSYFLFQVFRFLRRKGIFAAMSKKAVNQTSINQTELSKLKLLIPKNLDEQKAIAKILSTVDEAIQKSDLIIEKTERLKRGLMRELLTKNRGEKIKLGEKILLEYGKGLPERERKEGQYPVYGSNGIVGSHSGFLIEGPGIVMGRKGTIGAVVWSDKNFWPIDTTYFVKLKDEKVNLRWLYYKLISLNLSRLNMATGTPGLNRDLVYIQEAIFPNPKEQTKIASILSTVDKKLELERKRKEKLERIKKGLMNDLLSGRKRVDVEEVLAIGG